MLIRTAKDHPFWAMVILILILVAIGWLLLIGVTFSSGGSSVG